ncbi:MAG: flagellar hook-associated protein FlgK [Bombella apis]|nr:flagellar hook-associated protein FlgK [Bombella apis]
MSLGLSLNIASSGLKTIENELSTTSDNISNASTPGYVAATPTPTSMVVSGMGVGVTTNHNRLVVSQALQDALYHQNAQVAALTATSNSLAAVSSVQGTTTSSDGSTAVGTLTNNLQNVNNAFVSLTSTPQDSAAQKTVISAAQTLVSNIHTLSSVYQAQRQGAQDAVTDSVSGINTDLTTIGQLSQQIMLARSSHADTSDLANKRYEAMQSLSSKLGVNFTEKPNGDMLVSTQDGTSLPTRPDQLGLSNGLLTGPSSTWPLTTQNATLSSSMYHATDGSDKGVPGIMLAGKDITSHLTGGTLGANLTLRDQTYPQMQAQLDSFSYTLINRFNAAGVSLFSNGTTQNLSSDPTKTAPNGLVGLSSQLAVSDSYLQAPARLTENLTGLQHSNIKPNAVLNQAFGSGPSSVTNNLMAPMSGLGPDGQQSTGYEGAQSLTQLATALTANQAQTISQSNSDLSTATSIQTSLSTKVASVSGVDVNSQMAAVVALKTSYSANAKVVSMVQTMFDTLLNAVH